MDEVIRLLQEIKSLIQERFPLSVLRNGQCLESERSIESGFDIYSYAAPIIGDLEQEAILLIALNPEMKVLKSGIIILGLEVTAPLSAKQVFRRAMLWNASSIVLVHNHPTGDARPSPQDVVTARKIAEAGSILGIPLFDFVVIGKGRYSSLREMNQLGRSR